MKRMLAATVSSVLLLTAAGSARADAALVRDMDPLAVTAPQDLVEKGGWLHFPIMSDEGEGYEYARIDGSEFGIRTTDIWRGSGSSSPDDFVVVNNVLYFTAEKKGFGRELYKSGSRLMDINAGEGGSNPRNLTGSGGVLFFSADDGINGRELWRSDGTETGTFMIRDVQGGPAGSIDERNPFVVMNGILFFSADDGVHGLELWQSDGTAAGTALVIDACPGACDGLGETPFAQSGGQLYFGADDGVNGRELWRSDGTAAGTGMVADIQAGAGAGFPGNDLAAMGGSVFFAGDDGLAGPELWRSDGTAPGTVLVREIVGGPRGGRPRALAAAGTLVYFGADDGVQEGLWRTDGTTAGTFMIESLQVSDPPSSAFKDGFFYLSADDGVHGGELWRSDGSPGGTSLVRDICPGACDGRIGGFAELGAVLHFHGSDSDGAGIYRTDGTAAGTALVYGGFSIGAGSDPSYFADGGMQIYFNGSDGRTDAMWRSDGTANGTVRVKDVEILDQRGVILNGIFYFSGAVGCPTSCVEELWRSDGTTAGTFPLTGPTPPLGRSRGILSLTLMGGQVYFSADDGVHGLQLWRSDGTAPGTVMVTRLNTASEDGSGVFNLRALNGRLYFTAQDGIHGQELWRSDGTAAGTTMVRDIRPGKEGSNIHSLVGLVAGGGQLLFSADDGVHGSELWRSDGTAAGTLMVRDIEPPGPCCGPQSLVEMGGDAYFVADDGVHGQELWRSDGTAAGTRMVKDLNPGPDRFFPGFFSLWTTSNLVFFVDELGNQTYDIWRSDGTAAGTFVAKRVQGFDFDGPYLWDAEGRVMYFTMDDATHGRELWRSDGTAAGTFMVADIWPGSRGSDPMDLTSICGELYFSAADPFGRELWKFEGNRPVSLNVRADGSDDWKVHRMGADGKLEITVEVDAGSRSGDDADWWLRAVAPGGNQYWFDRRQGWVPSATPRRAYAGPLRDIGPRTVLDTARLPGGRWRFDLGIDAMDGYLRWGACDTVNVQVKR